MKNEKKLRVLIVDDEFRIGQLIGKLVQWDSLNLELCGYAENGKAALEMIAVQLPDIIITDIKMPVMNGLELIKHVKEQGLNPRFIVVSGFKEFDYAHTALKYGVEDYLLKPIKDEELNTILKRIITAEDMVQNQQDEDDRLKKTIERSKALLYREAFNELGKIDREQFNENYQLKLEDTIYRTIVVKLDYRSFEDRDDIQDKFVLENTIRIIEKSFKDIVNEQILTSKEHLMIYGIFNYDHTRVNGMEKIFQGILTEIKNYVYAFTQYEVTMGVGSQVVYGEIWRSLQVAYKGAFCRIVLGTGRTIYLEDIVFEPCLSGKEIIERNKIRIENIVESLSRQMLEQLVSELYGELRNSGKIDSKIYSDVALCLIESVADRIENETVQKKLEEITEKVFHCYNLSLLTNTLKSELGQVLDTIKEEKEQQPYKPIRKAQKYMEENYAKKIILEDVASVVGLNPIYFSNLFKKETGKNFSSFLVELRMEQAKRLLRATDETMVSIAEQVGYQDTRYFSQMFHKIVGIKPSTYRKLYS